MESVRCSFEVVAGLIPDTPMPELTRQFHVLSREWDGGSEAGIRAFQAKQGEAMVYALSLQHPSNLNWVRLDWVWY